MRTTLDKILGGKAQATAASYLADYLKLRSSVKFSREEFSQWLVKDTHANGAFGYEYVMEGFDQLKSAGYIKAVVGTDFEATPKFVEIIQDYI